MTQATFREILALRGRIFLLTANAQTGLEFERTAERDYAEVIHTRGWADPYGPLHAWHRLNRSREYGVLSCDQRRYLVGFNIPCTDVVWVGPTGQHTFELSLTARWAIAMSFGNDFTRHWTLSETDL